MKEDNLWYLPWVVRPDLLHGTQYFVPSSLGVIRRRRRAPLATSLSGKPYLMFVKYADVFEGTVQVVRFRLNRNCFVPQRLGALAQVSRLGN
jgi:hypothetical protein